LGIDNKLCIDTKQQWENYNELAKAGYFWKVKNDFWEIYEDGALCKVIVSCRGGGKTVLAIQLAMKELLAKKSYKVLFLSTSYKKVKKTVHEIMRSITRQLEEEQEFKCKYNGTDYEWVIERSPSDIRTFSYGSYEEGSNIVGLHPDMIILDEAGLMDSNMFSIYIYPMLNHLNADEGKIVVIGTARGHNKFWELYNLASSSNYTGWKSYNLKASETTLLHPDKVEKARKELPEEVFEQEYENNFDISIGSGFIYGKSLYEIRNQINNEVTYNIKKPVYLAWDLGHSHLTVCWIFQTYGNDIHLIDYYEGDHEHISTHCMEVLSKNYPIALSIVPHDSTNKRIDTYSTSEEIMSEMGLKPYRIDRTNALYRSILDTRDYIRNCYFNAERCAKGLNHLKNYKIRMDPKTNLTTRIPVQDEHVDAADAFRYIWEGKAAWFKGQEKNNIEYIRDPLYHYKIGI
jgi:hypothetical protein